MIIIILCDIFCQPPRPPFNISGFVSLFFFVLPYTIMVHVFVVMIIKRELKFEIYSCAGSRSSARSQL